MNTTKRRSAAVCAVVLTCFLTFPAAAEVRLSSDWEKAPPCVGVGPQPSTPQEQFQWLAEVQQGKRQYWRYCPKDEGGKVNVVSEAMVSTRSAVDTNKTASYDVHFPFILFVDGTKYYTRGATFMPKIRPDEVCSVVLKKAADGSDYHCKEGQRYKKSCNMLFIDANFKDAGFYTLKINEPYEYYCNAMPALGTANKQNNELLVTVQYFPIDRKLASKVSEIGSGWKRMTILFRVKAEDGKIVVEQDDSCLKNPNDIETIPDARQVLRQCRSKQ